MRIRSVVSETARVALAALVLFLGACGGDRIPAPVVGLQETTGGSYTVRPGDNIYSIAWGLELDYRLLASWNRLQPPYRLRKGQTLALYPQGAAMQAPTEGARATIPGAVAPVLATPQLQEVPLEPLEPVTPPAAEVTELRPPVRQPPPPPPPSAATGRPGFGKVRALAWEWPLSGGKVTPQSGVRQKVQGIRIGSRAGVPVYAAESGVVTYVGPFPGYGNLLIIQHDPSYLSAYGWVQSPRVREASRIEKGMQVAEVAATDGALYFEIRKDGKPVDPVKLLPPVRR